MIFIIAFYLWWNFHTCSLRGSPCYRPPRANPAPFAPIGDLQFLTLAMGCQDQDMSHDRIERRSLAVHQAIAAKLRLCPDLLGTAQDNI